MPKALRKSTLKQRESREEKERIKSKTIEKKKRKSSISKAKVKEERRAKIDNLQEEIQLNQVIIQEGISELSSLQEFPEDSGSSSSSASSNTVFNTPISSPRGSQVGSEASLAWDGQVDLLSPLKDTSDLLDTTFVFSDNRESETSPPPALTRDRSVSVSVNRASFLRDESGEIVSLEPVCRSLDRVLDYNPVPTGAVGLINQESFLERNLRAKELETLRIVEESDEGSVDGERIDEEQNLEEEEINNPEKMDETNFNAKVKALQKSYRRVQDKISSYTSEDVSVVDKDEYNEHLKSIRKKHDEFIEEVNTVIDELDEENEKERVELLSKMKSDAKKALRDNENEVKNKLAELLANYEENKPLSKQELKVVEQNAQKLRKRMGFVKEKSVEIKNTILKAKKAAEMTDNEVRECIMDSKD